MACAMTNQIVVVVAVALLAADSRVLMQRRRLGRQHGGLWEFPGGKVEPGENPRLAAIREIDEELSIRLRAEDLSPVGFAMPAADEAPGPVILLFSCARWEGEPACLDAEEIGWVPCDSLSVLAMPPLDYPLAEALLRVVAPR